VASDQDYTDSHPQSFPPPKSLFRDDVVSPDRCSPAPSSGSLERYLAAPTSEEAIPTATIEAAIQDGLSRNSPDPDQLNRSWLPKLGVATLPLCDACRLKKALCVVDTSFCAACVIIRSKLFLGESGPEVLPVEAEPYIPNWRQPSPASNLSVMGSDASAGSGNSHGSFNSLVSVSSRASRRGRKRWGQALTPPSALRRRCSSPAVSHNHVSPSCKLMANAALSLKSCTKLVAVKRR